jgi:hypothetical protein
MLLDAVPDLKMTGRPHKIIGGEIPQPDQSADRLRVSPSLPVRGRALQVRVTTVADIRRSHRRLPPGAGRPYLI